MSTRIGPIQANSSSTVHQGTEGASTHIRAATTQSAWTENRRPKPGPGQRKFRCTANWFSGQNPAVAASSQTAQARPQAQADAHPHAWPAQNVEAILHDIVSLVDKVRTKLSAVASGQDAPTGGARSAAALHAPADILSRQKIDAILCDLLATVAAIRRLLPAADGSNGAAPAAAPPRDGNAGHRDHQSKAPVDRLENSVAPHGGADPLPGRARPAGEPGTENSLRAMFRQTQYGATPSTQRPAAPAFGFDPEQLRKATAESIKSAATEQLERNRKVAVERLAEAYFSMYPGGISGAGRTVAIDAAPSLEATMAESLLTVAAKTATDARTAAAEAAAKAASSRKMRIPGHDPLSLAQADNVVHDGASREVTKTTIAADKAQRAYHLRVMIDARKPFEAWLKANKLQTVFNGGTGNNCLIISILQHATGQFEAGHQAEAARWRRTLVSKYGIGQDQMLTPDMAAVTHLLDELGTKYPPRMHLTQVRADPDGIPCLLDANSIPFSSMNDLNGGRIVPIYNAGEHFEPVIAQ